MRRPCPSLAPSSSPLPGRTPVARDISATWPAPTYRPTSSPAITGRSATGSSWFRGAMPTARRSRSGRIRRASVRRTSWIGIHAEFLANWRSLGISWDLYTSTATENHAEVTQDIFMGLAREWVPREEDHRPVSTTPRRNGSFPIATSKAPVPTAGTPTLVVTNATTVAARSTLQT